MGKKYELTDETIQWAGYTLHRICALRDFGDVSAGDLGGWVESEDNLSHDGLAWIYDEGKVYDRGKVYGNGKVYDDGEVYGYGNVYSNGMVYHRGQVYDNGRVYEDGQVYGNSRVYGRGQVYGYGRIFGDMHATRPVIIISGLLWPVTISDEHMAIGCQAHPINDWAAFGDEEITTMDRDALKFWSRWKRVLLTAAKLHMHGWGRQ